LDLLQAQIWYSFFLYSRIFTGSIMTLLPSIRKALEEVYVIVVTRFTTRVDSLRLQEWANRSSL
jgi:hypothetical protein